jgi:hypothetical protein
MYRLSSRLLLWRESFGRDSNFVGRRRHPKRWFPSDSSESQSPKIPPFRILKSNFKINLYHSAELKSLNRVLVPRMTLLQAEIFKLFGISPYFFSNFQHFARLIFILFSRCYFIRNKLSTKRVLLFFVIKIKFFWTFSFFPYLEISSVVKGFCY